MSHPLLWLLALLSRWVCWSGPGSTCRIRTSTRASFSSPRKLERKAFRQDCQQVPCFFFYSCKRASSPPHHLYSGAGGFPIQSVQGRLSETLCQKRRGTTTASTFPSFAPTASPQPRISWMTGSPISWNLHLYWTYRRTSHQKCIEHIEKQGQGY